MRRLIVLTIFSLSLLMGLKAQHPGIMGRKFVVAVMGTIAPPARNSYLTADFTKQRKGPALGYGMQLEYVLSRRSALNLQLTPGFANYQDNYSGYYTRERSLMTGLKLRTYAFQRSGNLAPIGGFGDIGLAVQMFESKAYMNPPGVGATPDEIRTSFAPFMIFGIGRAWLRGRFWGEFGLQMIMHPLLTAYIDLGTTSRGASLNILTLRLGIGILN